jgi:hypothetical protein
VCRSLHSCEPGDHLIIKKTFAFLNSTFSRLNLDSVCYQSFHNLCLRLLESTKILIHKKVILHILLFTRSRNSSFGLETGYRLDVRGSIHDRGKRFFFTASRPAVGPTPPPIQWIPGVLFPRVKLATHLYLVPRSGMVELYLHSPIQGQFYLSYLMLFTCGLCNKCATEHVGVEVALWTCIQQMVGFESWSGRTVILTEVFVVFFSPGKSD